MFAAILSAAKLNYLAAMEQAPPRGGRCIQHVMEQMSYGDGMEVSTVYD